MAPNDVVYSCGCVTRDHSVAFLRNGAPVFYRNHDGMVVDVVCFHSVACHDIRVRVSCAYHNDVRVAYDTLALYDILVCAYDILVFYYNHHDEKVACNDHSDDGLAYPRDVAVVVVDNEAYALHSVAYDLHSVACALHGDTVYAPRERMDSEAPMMAYHIYLALELALPIQLPKMTRKLSAI